MQYSSKVSHPHYKHALKNRIQHYIITHDRLCLNMTHPIQVGSPYSCHI